MSNYFQDFFSPANIIQQKFKHIHFKSVGCGCWMWHRVRIVRPGRAPQCFSRRFLSHYPNIIYSCSYKVLLLHLVIPYRARNSLNPMRAS